MGNKTTEDMVDLMQYVTNLLYYARDNTKDMSADEFDKWAEEQVLGIDEYFKAWNSTFTAVTWSRPIQSVTYTIVANDYVQRSKIPCVVWPDK